MTIHRLSLRFSQVAHQARAYCGFCSMTLLGVFLLPHGWDASPSQGYSQQYPFIFLGGERYHESKVSCPGTQHTASAIAITQTTQSRVQHTNHKATAPTHYMPGTKYSVWAITTLKKSA